MRKKNALDTTIESISLFRLINDLSPYCKLTTSVPLNDKTVFVFSIILQHRDGASISNPSSWKTKTCPSYTSNSMVADVMATWRSSASAFMILLVFLRYPTFITTRVNATLADLFDPIMPYWPTFVLVMYWWGQPIPHMIIFARVLNQKNNNIIVSVSTVLHNGLYVHISPCYGLF